MTEKEVPLEKRSWREIGKYLTIHAGKWAIIGASLGLGVGGGIYYGGRGVVEDSVNPKIDEQGDKVKGSVDDQGKSVKGDINWLKENAGPTFETVDEVRVALCKYGLYDIEKCKSLGLQAPEVQPTIILAPPSTIQPSEDGQVALPNSTEPATTATSTTTTVQTHP